MLPPFPDGAPCVRPAVAADGIAVIANRKSGTNARDRAAIDRAIEVLGRARTRLYHWIPGRRPAESMAALVRAAISDGAGTIVAAGGDGTAMGVAEAVLPTRAAFAALPLGTFNYFARGLGIPEDPTEAARTIRAGRPHDIRVGTVNGRVFLNNASLGIYPAILKQRETVYKRFGRHRLMAHWSVARTFLRFQRPMRLRIEVDGTEMLRRTPLLFVSRSAFQLDRFGLAGAEAISNDAFAVLIGRGQTRADLFRTAFRLVTQTALPGRDYDYIAARELRVHPDRPRALMAHDGEKALAPAPFVFRMSDDLLTVILPESRLE